MNDGGTEKKRPENRAAENGQTIIYGECSGEAEPTQPELFQSAAGWPPAAPPLHGYGWPRFGQPHSISHDSKIDP